MYGTALEEDNVVSTVALKSIPLTLAKVLGKG